MKNNVLLVFLGLMPLFVNGQILGQDEAGFSSILLPTANLNLDGTNNVISFSLAQYVYNNEIEYDYSGSLDIDNLLQSVDIPFKTGQEAIFKNSINSFKNNNKQLIENSVLAGIELNGQSKNGVSIFLSEGLLSTKASFIGTVGYQIEKRVYDKKIIEDYAYTEYRRIEHGQELDRLKKAITHKIKLLNLKEIVSKNKYSQLIKRINTGTLEEQDKSVKVSIQDLLNLSNGGYLDELEKGLSKEQQLVAKIEIMSKEAEKIFKKKNAEGREETKELKEFTTVDSNTLFEFRKKIFEEIEKLKSRGESNSAFHSMLNINIELEDYLDGKEWGEVTEKFTKLNILLKRRIKNFKDTSTQNKQFIDELIKEFKIYNFVLVKLKLIDDRQKKNYGKELDFNKHIFYFRGGFNGTSFKYDLANDSTSISDRIINRNFQGTRFELGYTHQFKTRNFLGLNISKNYTDNSSSLTSTTFKSKTIDTSVSPNLEISSEVTALSGKYDKFDRYEISVDYVRMLPLKYSGESKKSAEVYLNVNPYFRHRFYSNAETFKPNTSFGLGCFVFNVKKNSVGGGFFVQANDIFNNNRDEVVEFSKQISIGLVFKYAIDSFNPTK